MKTFLKTNLNPLKSPAGLFWNLGITAFVLVVLILIASSVLNINYESVLNPLELFKQTWYLFVAGYFLKFIWLYYGAKRVKKECVWLGAWLELLLFVIAFVIFYFTGDAGA